MIFRAYKYRLWPTADQAAKLDQFFAAVRTVYNASLEQRRTYGRRKGSDAFGRDCRFSAPRQAKEINFRPIHGRAGLLNDPELRWLSETPRECFDAALRDLDKAFDNFFAGRAGFPGYRSKNRNNSISLKAFGRTKSGSQIVPRVNILFGQNCVTLPKIGRIRYKRHRKFYGEPKTVEVSREGSEYYVILVCVQADRQIDHPGGSIGIDLGVALPVALSNGQCVHPDPGLKFLDARARDEGRKLSRKKKGSARRERQKRHLAAIRRKQARRRACRTHEITTVLTRRYGYIAIEDLRVRNMTASAKGTIEAPGGNVRSKAGLNREILNVSPFLFRQQLSYKAARSGSILVPVDPKNTSRTCPVCQHITADNRPSQAIFHCVECGHSANADINAAHVILARALASAGATARRKTPSESGCGSATSKANVSCLQPASISETYGESASSHVSDAAACVSGADCGPERGPQEG